MLAGLAPSIQTVGSLLRTYWPAKPAGKMINLKTYILFSTESEFADFLTTLFGDYWQLILYRQSYFGPTAYEVIEPNLMLKYIIFC